MKNYTMTEKEERTESLVWSTKELVNRLNDAVGFGRINARQIGAALNNIAKMNTAISTYIEYDDKAVIEVYLKEQLELIELLKKVNEE